MKDMKHSLKSEYFKIIFLHLVTFVQLTTVLKKILKKSFNFFINFDSDRHYNFRNK